MKLLAKIFASSLALFVLFASGSVFAAGRIPEKLIYRLSWSGIPVGTATQEIVDEGEVRRVVSTAKSNEWLSAFFPVNDRTDSFTTKEEPFPGKSYYFRMQIREGRRARDREITFDQAGRKAVYHDLMGTERVEVPIVENTYDIYSSFLHARFLDLQVGKPVYLHVLDGKELQRIEIRVLRKERVSTPVGEFDTIAIEPMVKPEGVFEGKKGAVIWLTDDHRRIPVKAQTKVKVGSVTALLIGGNY
ncbi:DUF3108 domain-containing protein [Geobacter pelophilus]|uniref:DUF3108 domain-containing protein n=1 Tax=Geoanaerobacter pelophilus TaxID=60036 RepID=A0AAW4L393_9BACT|nr:DUF3108 domain-containing protein [Geoanaerobacter pelophilus]MBT0663458.1 DUF3108 domain-containing protein [Geoanaerobacter pelophilus]